MEIPEIDDYYLRIEQQQFKLETFQILRALRSFLIINISDYNLQNRLLNRLDGCDEIKASFTQRNYGIAQMLIEKQLLHYRQVNERIVNDIMEEYDDDCSESYRRG